MTEVLSDWGRIPDGLDGVFALLGRVFSGFKATEIAAHRRGLVWEDASTPFAVVEGGRVLAHAGVLELPLVVGGEPVTAASIHAVCSDPDARGRGLADRAFTAALSWAAERFPVRLLTTHIPTYYERHGFRRVEEHLAAGPPPEPTGNGPPARRLDLDEPEDLTRLRGLLDDRAPVSRRLGVRPEVPVFLFDTVGKELLDLGDLEAVAVVERRDGAVLRFLDVVAPRMPRLAEVLPRIPGAVARVEVAFTADHFAPGLPVSVHDDAGDVLMACGEFAVDGPFMLSATARA